jgi:hypothetical protein
MSAVMELILGGEHDCGCGRPTPALSGPVGQPFSETLSGALQTEPAMPLEKLPVGL